MRRLAARAMVLLIGGMALLLALAATSTTPSRPSAPSLDGAQPASVVAGYLLAAKDGGVFTFGDAPFLGSMGATHLNKPIVDAALTPSGNGYVLFAEDGGVFTFGDAGFFGSLGGGPLNKPIVSADITPSGRGYVMVAEDGGVFTFGDAVFHGSLGATRLNQPIVDAAISNDNGGYILAAEDGGIFTFGSAPFFGSHGGHPLNAPVTALLTTRAFRGYALAAEDGGVFSFGPFGFHGAVPRAALHDEVVDGVATPSGEGYMLAAGRGDVFVFGDAVFRGSLAGAPLSAPIVAVMAPKNATPVALDDAYAATEDTTLTVGAAAGVLANDSDPEGDPLAVSLVSGPTKGTLTLSPNGAFTYVPNSNANGTDTFRYRAADGTLADGATVTITIAPVNDAPVAHADAANVPETGSTVLGVRANDVDLDGDALTITALGTGATAGTVTTDGANVTYTPVASADTLAVGESLTDTFTYTVTDAGGATSTATATITVVGANDAPVAVDDAAGIGENGSPLTVLVLANDNETDASDTIAVSAVDTTGTLGGVTNNGTDVTYDPAGAFESLGVGDTATDTFTYTVSDGHGGTDTGLVTITVTGANDAPDAVGDAAGVAEDGPAATVDVRANDTDVDGDTLTVTAVDTTGTVGTVTNNGTDVTYDPAGAFESLGVGDTDTDTFTYTVSDGHGGTDDATVTMTITGVNDAPVAVDDTVTVDEDSTGTDVLANDTDVDGDPLTITGVSAVTGGGTVTNHGTSVTYDTNGDFESLGDGDTATATFTYTIGDGNGGTDTATVTVTITGVNDAPDAVADGASRTEDGGGIDVLVLANDTDVEGDALTVTAVDNTGTVGLADVQGGGTHVRYRTQGVFDSLAVGESATDTFTYTVSDGNGGTDTATVTITINGVDDAPVATDDAITVTENAAATVIDVIANDTDVDTTDTLAVSGVDTTGTVGSVTNNGTDVTYDATAFDSLAVGESATDTFTYTVSDGNGGTDTATVTVTVNGVNDAPVAVDDATSTPETTAKVVSVLGNDTDADASDTLVVSAVDTTGTQGQVTNNGTDVTYDPNGKFDALLDGQTAIDTFTYTVSDGHGGTDTATVTVTITGITNQAPTAVDDASGANENGPSVTVDVLANDTDPEGDTLTITGVSSVTGGGTVTNNGTDVTFDPNGAFEGLDAGETATPTFTYTIGDGFGNSDTATVTMTVTGSNDAPVANDDTPSVSEDSTGSTVLVRANDTDVDVETLTVTAVDTTGTVGTVTNNGTDVTYDPNGQFESLAVGETATDTFTYTISDGTVTDTATVTVTVNGVNDAPAAADDATGANENGPSVNVDVLANDTDTDASDTLAVSAVDTTGTVGSVTNNGTDVTYDPNGKFEALDSGETAFDTFTYTVSDGHGSTDTATVTMTVTGSNDAPVANDDTPTVNEDSTGDTVFVLANDTDPDASDTPSVTGVDTTGTVGTVTNNGTDVTYDPNGQFENLAVGETATDTFTYTISDGTVTDTATVTVTVTGVNDGPTAADDAAGAGEGGSAATVNVKANDTDPDSSDTLTVTAVDTTGTVGDVTLTSGTVSYDPNGKFEALATGETDTDTFTYTISDGHGGTDTATVTVTITGANDAPGAVDDGASTAEFSSTNVPVLSNDVDPDASDTLTVSGVDTTGTQGQVTNNGTDVTYDPNGKFDALNDGETDTDTFTYTVSDGHGGTDTATVTITINGSTNGSPTAVDDASGANENGPGVTVDVLANDTDPDTDPLTVSAVDTTGTSGTVTNNTTDVTYDPNGQFESLAAGETDTDTFTYTVDDGRGGTDTATVTITITGANDSPTAVDDGPTVDEDASSTTVSVLANDTDPDTSDTLTVTAVDTTGTVGTVTNNGTDVSYDPNGQFEALAVGEAGSDTFTYTVSDGNGGTDTATVTVTVNGVNDPVVATADAANVGEDSTGQSVLVLANDTDPDTSDTLTVTAVDTTGTTGSVTNNGTDVTYDPNGQFESLGTGDTDTDTFTYTVSDGNGSTDTETVTITIDGANDAPTAVDDTSTVGEDSTGATVSVLANDTDPESDTLAVSAVDTTGTVGSVTNNGTDVTYDPNGQFESLGAGETGTDTFTYTASDGNGGTDTATVTITISGVNDSPTAVDDTPTVGEDSNGATVSVLANDTDPESDTLAVSAVDTTGTTGSVTNNGTDVTYDPNGQFESLAVGETDTDTFTYTVSDGNGGTDTATVTVTINGANDAPTAADDTPSTSEDGPSAGVNVKANDTDPDTSDTLTVTAVDTTGTTGSVSLVAGVVSYDPNGKFESLNVGDTDIDTFGYTISDGHGGTDTATVTVTINGVNDAPDAVDDAFATAIGNTKFAVGVTVTGEPVVNVSGNILTNDTDVDDTHASLVPSFESAPVGAAVTVNADGSFTYVSPPGFTGTGTFQYRTTDPGGAFDVATVSITVSQTVWYVDNSLAAGNGTSVSPYNSLTPFGAIGELDDPSDFIFLYQGSGNYTQGIALESSQKLWGQPFGLVVSGTTLVTAGGSNPVIGNTSGSSITLAEGVDIQRVNVGTTTGDGITGTSVNTFTIGASTAISGVSGADFKLNGGSGTISVPTTITNTAGRSLDIANRTGGTLTFTGAIGDTGTGISLVNNDGATVTLAGGLTSSTGTSPAFSATAGGTVNVTGSTNTLVTTTGTALTVTGTDIGASNLNFRSIASNGAARGIDLDTTGSSGALVVAGNGSAGTGGTITNSTNDGIRLKDTRNTSLSWMNVNTSATVTAGANCTLLTAADCASGIDMVNATNVTLNHMSVNGSTQQGVSGDNVNGLTITNSTIDNAGNANDEFGALWTQLSGTVLIQDTVIDHPREGAVRLHNTSGTLNLTFRRVTMKNNLDTDGLEGEDGLQMTIDGGTTNVLVDDSVFTQLERDGIDGLVTGTATMNVTIKDSDITELEGGGIILNTNNTANLNTTINNNVITNVVTTGINVISTVNTTVNATITNNTMTNPAPQKTQNGFPIRLSQEEDGDFTALVQSNSTSGFIAGVKALGRLGDLNTSAGTSSGDTGTLHVKFLSNTFAAPLDVDFGLELNITPLPAGSGGQGTAGTENAMCAVVKSNNSTGFGGGAGIRTRQGNSSQFRIEELTAGAQTGPTTSAYLNGANTSSPAAVASTPTTSYTGVAAGTCRSAVTTPLPS
jgi:VCBS repeat-containing protein